MARILFDYRPDSSIKSVTVHVHGYKAQWTYWENLDWDMAKEHALKVLEYFEENFEEIDKDKECVFEVVDTKFNVPMPKSVHKFICDLVTQSIGS